MGHYFVLRRSTQLQGTSLEALHGPNMCFQRAVHHFLPAQHRAQFICAVQANCIPGAGTGTSTPHAYLNLATTNEALHNIGCSILVLHGQTNAMEILGSGTCAGCVGIYDGHAVPLLPESATNGPASENVQTLNVQSGAQVFISVSGTK